MKKLNIIFILVFTLLFSLSFQLSHGESTIIESCTKVDAIHAALLTSKYALSGELKCEYLGLIAKQQPLRGFLQSQPGVWRLNINSKIFYLSLTNNIDGFHCTIKNAGSFNFMVADENGNNAKEVEIVISKKRYQISKFLQEIFNKFDLYDKIWPNTSNDP